jgi:hyperosmotically inducible protein
MGKVYLVGHTSGDAQSQQVIAVAQGTEGVRSVDTYLVTTPEAGGESALSDAASDLALDAQVKAALGLSGSRPLRIDVAIVAGHVVLLGVVASQDAIDAAAQQAGGVSGVTGVTNFLLLPEPGYERLRPGLAL